MAAIAHGMVQGCMEYYNDRRSLEWECAVDGKSAIFRIKG
jgi:hypothetical protein